VLEILLRCQCLFASLDRFEMLMKYALVGKLSDLVAESFELVSDHSPCLLAVRLCFLKQLGKCVTIVSHRGTILEAIPEANL
jgi:hypothetical protein